MGEIESRPRLLRLQAVVHLTKGETKEEDEREDQETLAFSISLDFAFTNRVLPPRRPDVAFHHDRSSLFLPPSLPHSLFLSHTHTCHASPFIPKRNEKEKRASTIRSSTSSTSRRIYLFVVRRAASQPCIFIDMWKYIKIKIRPYPSIDLFLPA